MENITTSPTFNFSSDNRSTSSLSSSLRGTYIDFSLRSGPFRTDFRDRFIFIRPASQSVSFYFLGNTMAFSWRRLKSSNCYKRYNRRRRWRRLELTLMLERASRVGYEKLPLDENWWPEARRERLPESKKGKVPKARTSARSRHLSEQFSVQFVSKGN